MSTSSPSKDRPAEQTQQLLTKDDLLHALEHQSDEIERRLIKKIKKQIDKRLKKQSEHFRDRIAQIENATIKLENQAAFQSVAMRTPSPFLQQDWQVSGQTSHQSLDQLRLLRSRD